jgi:tRNA-dihydrouridine synthase B
VKDAVSIPVIANGDIIDSTTARTALKQSGADGVMVGRGSQGQPWILAQIAHQLYGTPAPHVPQGADFTRMVADHYEEIIRFYGTTIGLRAARKHLGWYMDTCATPTDLRRAILTATDPQTVQRLIDDAMVAHPAKAAA